MSWRIGVAGLALLLVLPLSAGAVDDGAKVAEAERAVAELDQGYREAQAEMKKRLAELREGEEYKKAREAKDFDKLGELNDAIRKPVMEEWQKKFADAATPFDGSEGEVVFAAALMKHYLAADPAAVVLSTLGEHPKSPRLGPILDVAPYFAKPEKAGAFRERLAQVIAENPDVAIRAHAHFARAEMVRYDNAASDELKAQAELDRAAVLELVPETSILSMRVRGPDFEKTRLQVGMVAPEIVGPDLFGKTLRLSDFRGKVVMLDFWGDW